MFWKKFGQAQSANKLFNQASDHWRRRQQFLLQKDEAGAEQACLEVIRLCQLSIQSDEKMGDAYVLLSNALSVAASHTSGPLDPERYKFLQSRAAAVIHFWYSLPHRDYPITKNTSHGERLWRILVDEVRRDMSLPSDNATIAVMESYRDNLAAETILPDSFEKIKTMIVRTTETLKVEQPKEWEPLEEVSLSPETWHFLVEAARKNVGAKSRTMQKMQDMQDTSSRIEAISAKLQNLQDFERDSPRIFEASTELLERIRQAHADNDLREAIGWIAWLHILQTYSQSITPDNSNTDKKWEVLSRLLTATMSKARQEKDYDTLLLVVGFYEWYGLSELGDELLRFMYDEIGKPEVLKRLAGIEQQPLMQVESLLVNRLHRHLGNQS